MILKINYELTMKVFGEYLFDRDNFMLYEKGSDDAEFLEEPLPFPHLSDYDCKMAFIESFNDKMLSEKFSQINDSRKFSEKFWEFTDDGGERYSAYFDFEMQFSARIIAEWCGKNNIPFYLDKSDGNLMFFFKNVSFFDF